jgi:hypothetical protein
MTESKTSSATQLYQILNSAYACNGTLFVTEVWKEVLQFDPARDRTIENRYIEVIKLFSFVKSDLEEMSSSGAKAEKYFLAIDTILSAFCTVSFDDFWNSIQSRINISTLHLLESCGDEMITHGICLKEATPEEINEILADVINLVSELEKSDIDSAMKSKLIQKLRKIELALTHHQIFGVVGLKQVTEQSLGEMVIIAEQLSKNDTSEILKTNVIKVIDILSKCNSVYTLGEKVYPHLNHAVHNLPSFVNSIQHLLTGH